MAISTQKQYHAPLKSWHKFCVDFRKNEFNPKITDVIHFLYGIKAGGASYGTLNTYRSALSLVTIDKIGEHPLVSRFMKGSFREKPTRPKYKATWDVHIVLDKLKQYYPLQELDLPRLSEKLTMLLLLATGHRVQTIWSINIDNLKEVRDGIWADIDKIIKTTRPGTASPLLFLPKCPDNPDWCVASTLIEYLNRTRYLRGETKDLFITTVRPHGPASKETVSRWAKKVLADCGIDTSIYTSHSTRHASTSLAKAKGIDLDTLRKTAGWSEGSKVFQQFYNVPVLGNDQRLFSQAVLNNKQR